MKPKVVYVIAEVAQASTFEWLADSDLNRDCDLSFILLNPAMTPLEGSLKRKGFDVIRLQYRGRRDLIRVFFQLWIRWVRNRPNVVHTHQFPANFSGLLAALFCGVKTRIYTRHHSIVNKSNPMAVWIYDSLVNQLATQIIATCINVKNVLQISEGVPASKVRVVHFGFQERDFRDIPIERVQSLRKKYGLEAKDPVLGVISRYTEYKGIQYVIPAFKEVLKDFPKASLILANATQSPYGTHIHELLTELPADSYREIAFEEDNAGLFQLFDVFVHVPIDSESEAFGQIYVEALFAGIPSVFTLSGVAPEFVQDAQNACVVEFRDSDGIYRAVASLLKDRDLRTRLSDQGLKDVRRLFSLAKMIETLRTIYLSAGSDSESLGWVARTKKSLHRFPFFHANFVLGIMTGARLFLGLLKSKFSAVILGASGVGILGIGSQVQMLGITWGSLSMGASFLNRVCGAATEEKEIERRAILATTFTIQLVCNGLLVGIGLWNARWISKIAFGDPALSKYIVPVLISVPFYSLISTYFSGILFSHGRYAWYSRMSVISAVIEGILFLGGLYLFGLAGALWALTLGVMIWCLLLLFPLLRLEKAGDLFRLGFDWDLSRDLLTSSLVMILTSSSAYLSSVGIRIWISKYLGIDKAGVYQVLTVFFGYYSPLMTNGIWAQLFPKVSREGMSAGVCGDWADSLVLTAIFGALVQVAFLVMPETLIGLIYSKGFLEASPLFPLQCLGDLFFLSAQPSLGVLLANRDTKTYLFVWSAYFAVLSLLSLLLVQKWGLLGVCSAYFISSVGLWSYTAVYYARSVSGNKTPLVIMSLAVGAATIQSFLAWNHSGRSIRWLILLSTVGMVAAVFRNKSGSSKGFQMEEVLGSSSGSI